MMIAYESRWRGRKLVKSGEKRRLSAADFVLLLRIRFALQEYEVKIAQRQSQIADAHLGSMALSLAPWSGLSQFIRPENVTFIGGEQVAAEIKSSVFAVQVSRTNQSNNLVWTLLGSGFLLGRSNLTFGVTCDHVVTHASKKHYGQLLSSQRQIRKRWHSPNQDHS
jgi:hypothetical protein